MAVVCHGGRLCSSLCLDGSRTSDPLIVIKLCQPDPRTSPNSKTTSWKTAAQTREPVRTFHIYTRAVLGEVGTVGSDLPDLPLISWKQLLPTSQSRRGPAKSQWCYAQSSSMWVGLAIGGRCCHMAVFSWNLQAVIII